MASQKRTTQVLNHPHQTAGLSSSALRLLLICSSSRGLSFLHEMHSDMFVWVWSLICMCLVSLAVFSWCDHGSSFSMSYWAAVWVLKYFWHLFIENIDKWVESGRVWTLEFLNIPTIIPKLLWKQRLWFSFVQNKLKSKNNKQRNQNKTLAHLVLWCEVKKQTIKTNSDSFSLKNLFYF